MPEVRAVPMIIAGEPVGAAGGGWIRRESGIESMDKFFQTESIWLNAAETAPTPFDPPKM